jgi:hypothetical protein
MKSFTDCYSPHTSTAGVGVASKYDGMCRFACRHGRCPIDLCRVTATGPMIDVPQWNIQTGPLRTTMDLSERLLCKFTMTYGYADKDVCFEPPPPPPPPTSTRQPPPPSPTPTNVFRVYMGKIIDCKSEQHLISCCGNYAKPLMPRGFSYYRA